MVTGCLQGASNLSLYSTVLGLQFWLEEKHFQEGKVRQLNYSDIHSFIICIIGCLKKRWVREPVKIEKKSMEFSIRGGLKFFDFQYFLKTLLEMT